MNNGQRRYIYDGMDTWRENPEYMQLPPVREDEGVKRKRFFG